MTLTSEQLPGFLNIQFPDERFFFFQRLDSSASLEHSFSDDDINVAMY